MELNELYNVVAISNHSIKHIKVEQNSLQIVEDSVVY